MSPNFSCRIRLIPSLDVASSIDQYATQMHTEMDALGEGGTVEMDMGVQIIFLDGKESLDGQEPSLYGSKYANTGIKDGRSC